LTALVAGHTQKIAYVNSDLLLSQLKMVERADNELRNIQQKYITDGQTKVVALEEEYKVFLAEANSGNLSKKQIADKEAALQAKRQEIIDYDTKARVAAEAQRESLFRPILNRIDEVIYEIGQEKGYDFIFDSGMGHLLYKSEAQDITEMIRARMEP